LFFSLSLFQASSPLYAEEILLDLDDIEAIASKDKEPVSRIFDKRVDQISIGTGEISTEGGFKRLREDGREQQFDIKLDVDDKIFLRADLKQESNPTFDFEKEYDKYREGVVTANGTFEYSIDSIDKYVAAIEGDGDRTRLTVVYEPLNAHAKVSTNDNCVVCGSAGVDAGVGVVGITEKNDDLQAMVAPLLHLKMNARGAIDLRRVDTSRESLGAVILKHAKKVVDTASIEYETEQTYFDENLGLGDDLKVGNASRIKYTFSKKLNGGLNISYQLEDGREDAFTSQGEDIRRHNVLFKSKDKDYTFYGYCDTEQDFCGVGIRDLKF